MPSLYALGIGLLACVGSVLGENGVPTAKTKNGTYYGILGEYVSEDCLTLNSFRSNNGTSVSKLLPVVVYIHGGLFKHGSGRNPRYSMTSLLQVAFIEVTLNHLLSYWGFLYGQEVAEEGVANLGLKDQRLALRWISESIKAFGGDSEKVTIWGQEAGAYSVGLQLLAYGGRDDGLFRGAVVQSGSPTLMWPSVTAKEWQPLYNQVVNATNCTGSSDNLDCLRKVDASLSPTCSEAGNFVKDPLMMGTTQDERTWSYYGVENINTTSEFLDMVVYDGLSESAAKNIAQVYPDDPSQGIPSTLVGLPGNDTGLGYQWKRVSAYNGDKIMRAARRLASQSVSALSIIAWNSSVQIMRLDTHGSGSRVANIEPSSGQSTTSTCIHTCTMCSSMLRLRWQYGAQEQDDIAFFFHNVTLSESLSPIDQADEKKTFEPLSYLMTSMLIIFINTQDPNNVSSK
ncbi:carboxylesterase family protein [Penicillium malachiteum]|nr:carboxylesterase family protein [Penicillium malachiteum]